MTKPYSKNDVVEQDGSMVIIVESFSIKEDWNKYRNSRIESIKEHLMKRSHLKFRVAEDELNPRFAGVETLEELGEFIYYPKEDKMAFYNILNNGVFMYKILLGDTLKFCLSVDLEPSTHIY